MGQTIKLKASDGHELSAYEVAPPSGQRRGGLVIIQEIFGVNDHIRRVADGYADDGYHVVAPSLFDRAEPGVELGYDKPNVDRGVALRGKIPLDATLADIAAALEHLKASGKAGIVGYCWGGSLAWIGAARLSGLAATIGYYGGMIASHLTETPRCPVMLHFGESDSGISVTDVARVRASADPAMVQVFSYAGAGHAFNRDGSAPFHAPSAKLARKRTLAFLRKHVG